ncbi:MAG: NAD-dependent epimerase/dehydratase family protein [Thermodesulfobacteriota bacterium]
MTPTNPKKILVTGGGGFLGSAIVRRLVVRGDRVTTLSRSSYAGLESMDVRQIRADISDANAVILACRGMDMVIHTAAKPGVWGSYDEYYRPNVMGTENIVAACRHHHIPVLIHTSSPSVVFTGGDMEGVDETVPYPETFPTHYTKTKAMAEKMVVSAARQKDITAVVLRPHLIWGPGDPHLVPRVLARAKKLVKVGNRNNLVDTIYIEDAAAAHILAADRLAANPSLSGRIYFISQDEPIPMWDMINGILKAGGLPPITRTLPAGMVWGIGAVLEASYKMMGIKQEPPMTRFVARELATAHWFNISAAKRDLGYQPRYTIQQGLDQLARWLRP